MEAQPPQQQPTAHGKRSGAARRKLRKERQAQLDAQFAGLEIDPEKPPKLPAELVYYILDLASYNPSPADSSQPRARQRRAFLRSASLVCRDWRDEAQKLLWKDVTIHTNAAARSFLLSADKGHHTDRLQVWSTDDEDTVNGKVTKQVLEASRGVRVLSLDTIEDLCPTALFVSALTDVKSLTIEFVSFEDFPDPDHLPRGLPRLDDLTFNPLLNYPPSLPLITALLESGVRSATLELSGEPPRPFGNRRRRPQASESALPTAAPAPSFPIRTLAVLDIEFVDLLDAECLAPLLRKCVSVETLRYNLIEPKMFRYLGSQLLRLDITHPVSDEDDCDDLKNMLKAGFRSLQQLKQLGLECHPTMRPPPSAERVAVEQECKASGIECIWKE